MKFILSIVFIFLYLPVHAQQSESIPQPMPYSVENEKAVLKRITMEPDFVLDGQEKLPKLSAEDVKSNYQSVIPAAHDAYVLMTGGEGKLLPTGQWILFDSTKKEIVGFLAPSIASLVQQVAIGSEGDLEPVQVSIRAVIVSVKRPADPFLVWTDELINSHEPREVAAFSVIARSGEDADCVVDVPSKGKHRLGMSGVISDARKHIDARIDLSLLPTETYGGLKLSTGMTLRCGESLIHPIGISTDSNRQYVLKMVADVVDGAGKNVTPSEQ